MKSLQIKRAILSVTDKSGLVEFARFLHEGCVELVSTGGTRKKLAEAGLPVTSVSDVTGFPEIMGGRVKTLHPHVHAGILADKDNPEHMESLVEHGIEPFDMICVNLYDFARAAREGVGLRQAVEQIDIGGPTMLRAAAKNFHSILVVPTVEAYREVRQELAAKNFSVGLELRLKMAIYTFDLVSRYDAMIAEYLASCEK